MLLPTTDITGNQISFGYSYGSVWEYMLAAGDYVLGVAGDSTTPASETPFSVKAGERVEVTAAAPQTNLRKASGAKAA